MSNSFVILVQFGSIFTVEKYKELLKGLPELTKDDIIHPKFNLEAPIMNNQTPPEESQNIQQEEEELLANHKDFENDRNWLKIAEYVALGSAAIGSILAWLFEQFLFAATPLTVALALNLVSRIKLEESVDENIDLAIAEVYNSGEFISSNIDEMPTETTELMLENSQDTSESLRVEEESEVNSITNKYWEENNQRFLRVEENLKSLESAIAQLQKYGEVSTNKSSTELTLLQTNIAEIQQQVKKLQQQNREIIKPYLQRLNRSVKQLQTNFRKEKPE